MCLDHKKPLKKTTIELYNTLALPVLLSGSETWTIKARDGRRTTAAEMKYRVSQEECARLREGVPYVKVYRCNPKYLCPNLNGYGDNGQRSLKL